MRGFVFGVYPYIALSVLLIGSVARYERDPFTWKSGSSQLLRRRQLILGSVLFHIGMLIIFVGHFIGLLTPLWLLDGLHVGHEFKQILAIVIGGAGAIAALAGGFILLFRRLGDPRIRATSSWMDIFILSLLLFQLCLGSVSILISLQHIDGSEMIKFMKWAQAIFIFDTRAASYTQGTSWIFAAHIFTGLTIFILFPFSRLVHMLSVPVRYLWRPGYQIVRTRKSAPRQPAE